MARLSLRCNLAGIPVTRRGMILPFSVINFFRNSAFLKSSAPELMSIRRFGNERFNRRFGLLVIIAIVVLFSFFS